MTQPGSAVDPRDELHQLARALHATLEVLAEGGCEALGQNLPPMSDAALPSQPAKPEIARRTSIDPAPRPAAPARAAPPLAPAPVVTPRQGLTPEVSNARLSVLQQTVSQCTRCALHQGRTQTVFARGNGSAGLCFVGEGPGADEDAQGFPFVGKAGQLLDRMIVAMGMTRDEVYVCNIVKCRPPNNRKPDPEEMTACAPYLHEQLELISPQVIVALGATAVQGLLGTSEGITRMRGTWKLYRGKIPVMPTFHPAYLLRQPEAKREVWSDLQTVLKHMGREAPARR